jgi:lysophospholipase L1-like esterase
MTLIPFLLEGVGGEPELNQADGIHPTAEGHLISRRKCLAPIRKASLTDSFKLNKVHH